MRDEGLAPFFDLLGRRGVDHVGIVGGDLLVQALGASAEQVATTYEPCAVGPARRSRPRRSPSRTALVRRRRSGLRAAQIAGDQVVERHTPRLRRLTAPMSLTASRIFWPSSRTPITTSSEIEVSFLVQADARDGAVDGQSHDRLIGRRSAWVRGSRVGPRPFARPG